MAEQLGLEQRLGQGRAVHRHERAVGARARVVDGPGDQLLARARLALDEHGGVQPGHARDQLVDLRHLVRLAHQRVDALPRLQLLAELPVLAGEPPRLQRPPHHELDLLHPERLGQVVGGAGVHRLDGGGHRREGGQDDHGQVGLRLVQALEDAEAVEAGHPEVHQDEVEGLVLGHAHARLAAVGHAHPVALAIEGLGEQLARDLVVVGDEDERARAHRTGPAAGRITRNVLPVPSSLSTSIWPLCSRTIWDVMKSPSPVPWARLLGREERLEDALAIGEGDAPPGVGHRDLHVARPRPRRHLDPSARGRGRHGVGEQVQDDLLELVVLAEHGGQGGIAVDLEGEAGAGQARADEVGGVPGQAREVHGPRLRGHPPRHVEEPLDDLDDAPELGLDDREAALDVRRHDRRRQVLAQELQVPGDRVQRRAHLVRHLGHDASGEREALGVAEAALHLEEQRVELLHLPVAAVQLVGGPGDPGAQLVVEPRDALDHLVVVPGEHAELVARGHPDRRGDAVVGRARHRVHEAAERPVHDQVDGPAHEQAHEGHRQRGEREGPEADARGQLVAPLRARTSPPPPPRPAPRA